MISAVEGCLFEALHNDFTSSRGHWGPGDERLGQFVAS